MHKILADIIMVCHILFILFVIFTPFWGNNYMLLMHAIIVPFIMLHWVMNDNTCILTVVEKALRAKAGQGVDPNDCFTCRLIEPIYDFKKNYDNFSMFLYIITTVLWGLSAYKLYNKFKSGEITKIEDIMK